MSRGRNSNCAKPIKPAAYDRSYKIKSNSAPGSVIAANVTEAVTPLIAIIGCPRMPLSCSALVKAEALGAFHAQRPCYTVLFRHPCSPILGMHESTIYQEAFKQLVPTGARTDSFAHRSSPFTNPPTTKRYSSCLCWTHSLFTNPRHARIHHPLPLPLPLSHPKD